MNLRTPFPNQPRPEPLPGEVPEWEATDQNCPNCGAKLCAIKIKVSHPLVTGGKGTANYLGCPACPYASPAMIAAH